MSRNIGKVGLIATKILFRGIAAVARDVRLVDGGRIIIGRRFSQCRRHQRGGDRPRLDCHGRISMRGGGAVC